MVGGLCGILLLGCPPPKSNKATANREKENLGQYSFKWAVKSSKTATGAGPRASTVFEFGAI